MRPRQFPLFQSHLDLAHSYWKQVLSEGDTAIDATCGNGHDTLVLCTLPECKQVIAMDIQQTAIDSARRLLTENLTPEHYQKAAFYHQSHITFPEHLNKGSVKLIIYNLGYLPGADKTLTTQAASTIESLRSALDLIAPGGMISVTCYPGHPEGKIEEDRVLSFASTLSPKLWSCCHHRWLNRNQAPSLLVILSQL